MCGVAWRLSITFPQVNEPVPKWAHPVWPETVEINAFHSGVASTTDTPPAPPVSHRNLLKGEVIICSVMRAEFFQASSRRAARKAPALGWWLQAPVVGCLPAARTIARKWLILLQETCKC